MTQQPTIVLVSNQTEFGQLMQHLEGKGCVWNATKEKPTSWKGHTSGFPHFIYIYPDKTITWSWFGRGQEPIPFPEYAAKHIKPKAPKRRRKYMEWSKWEAMLAERDRLKAENAELKKDNDIWRKAGRETERVKNHALRVLEEANHRNAALNKAFFEMKHHYTKERELTQEALRKCNEIHMENTELSVRINEIENGKLENHLRNQRDNARFIAALFAIACIAFSVAIFIGKLTPAL